jgi:hypothetical protein
MSGQISSNATTQIPVPVVSPDKLPAEKGWTYTEIANIVGSLYLDTRKRFSLMEEQFSAVLSEYKMRLENAEHENGELKLQIAKLRSELERREKGRVDTTPDNSR